MLFALITTALASPSPQTSCTLAQTFSTNRAMAVGQAQGASAGLAVLDGFVPLTWLKGSYQWSAVLADLQRLNGDAAEAERYTAQAVQLAPTLTVAGNVATKTRQNGMTEPGRRLDR